MIFFSIVRKCKCRNWFTSWWVGFLFFSFLKQNERDLQYIVACYMQAGVKRCNALEYYPVLYKWRWKAETKASWKVYTCYKNSHNVVLSMYRVYVFMYRAYNVIHRTIFVWHAFHFITLLNLLNMNLWQRSLVYVTTSFNLKYEFMKRTLFCMKKKRK